nr:inositol monophosphatase [Azospirillum sp. SYSU D00513]
MLTFKMPDIDRVSSLMRDVAETEILPYFRDLANAGIREKNGPADLVTLADEAAERVLTPQLAALLPGSTVLGEEAASADPRLLERVKGDAPVWIIDPVDGTHNFAHGKPLFAVIVALVCRGETLAGWIYDPNNGRLATAVKGEGAWLDGKRARVAPPVPVDRMAAALSPRNCTEEISLKVQEGSKGVGQYFYLASAAQEYLRLLDGSLHATMYHRLMPWDHAAGVLMHAEAGGYAAMLNGTPYNPSVTGGGLMMAPDEASWWALHRHIFGTDTRFD